MSNLYINTTQNVKLSFTTASIGERILAQAIDMVIKTAYFIVVYFILTVLLNINETGLMNDRWSVTAILSLISLPVIFYTLVSETFMEGQTLGKKMVKIKVVKIDGYQAGLMEYFIRWILALIDIHMVYVPGIVSMLISKNTQRIGDLAAGTAVISEKSKYNISHTILMEVEENYQPFFSQHQMILFSDNDIRIIKENYEMALKQKNPAVLNKLAHKIISVLQIQNTFPKNKQLIETLLKDYNFHTGKQ